jgi:hypothetical protein
MDRVAGDDAAGAPATIAAMEIMGIRIPTIVKENVAIRCDACREIISGTPWRLNILDIVATELPAGWTDHAMLNPGPFQFHPDPSHVRQWMARRGYFFCRKGEVREIMRPVPLPLDPPTWGLCDGIHRDDHEFVPA